MLWRARELHGCTHTRGGISRGSGVWTVDVLHIFFLLIFFVVERSGGSHTKTRVLFLLLHLLLLGTAVSRRYMAVNVADIVAGVQPP